MIAPAVDPLARVGERYRLVECVRVDGARQCWRAVDDLLRRPVVLWLHHGLDPKAKGVTWVVRQDPLAGQPLARGTKATLHLDSANAR